MQYTWDSRCTFDMASVPKAVADQLKLASAPQLRVLLWLCCVGQGQFDAEACAAVCGGSPETCEEALAYWQARGLIQTVGSLTPPPAVPTAVPPVVPAAQETVDPPAPLIETVSPAVGRPSRSQVLQTQSADERFAFLLETASAKLGKILSPADMSVYLYLYRDLQLPPEVILMIIGYAVKNGKAKLSYIEKTAIGWVESGITTIAAADEHLCHFENCAKAWEQVRAWGALSVERPTVSQKEAACRWIYEWKLPREVIKTAMTYAAEKLGKFQASYIDRILEKWHEQGVATAAQAKEALTPVKPSAKPKAARMKTAKDRPPSFDLSQYEEQALRHRPRPPQQED